MSRVYLTFSRSVASHYQGSVTLLPPHIDEGVGPTEQNHIGARKFGFVNPHHSFKASIADKGPGGDSAAQPAYYGPYHRRADTLALIFQKVPCLHPVFHPRSPNPLKNNNLKKVNAKLFLKSCCKLNPDTSKWALAFPSLPTTIFVSCSCF